MRENDRQDRGGRSKLAGHACGTGVVKTALHGNEALVGCRKI